jgi:hypothetical protein
MNQDLYVRNGEFARYPLKEYIDEFADLRRSHIGLVKHLPAAAWERRGTVGDFTISVRAQIFVMVGHVRHHLHMLRDRYLTGTELSPEKR